MRHLHIVSLVILMGLLQSVPLLAARQAIPPKTSPALPMPNAAESQDRLKTGQPARYDDVRQAWDELLDKYPPSLREVLRIDPKLLRSAVAAPPQTQPTSAHKEAAADNESAV